MTHYGNRVRECRERLGWSQNYLANQVGGPWRQTTVVRVEAGEQPLKLTDAITLAGVFGLTLADFVGSDRSPCQCVAARQALGEALDVVSGALNDLQAAR